MFTNKGKQFIGNGNRVSYVDIRTTKSQDKEVKELCNRITVIADLSTYKKLNKKTAKIFEELINKITKGNFFKKRGTKLIFYTKNGILYGGKNYDSKGGNYMQYAFADDAFDTAWN